MVQREFQFKKNPTRYDLLDYLPTAARKRGLKPCRAMKVKELLKTIWKILSRGTGECIASREDIAFHLHCDPRSVTRYVRDAESLGVLNVRERTKGGQGSNWYAIDWETLDRFYDVERLDSFEGAPRQFSGGAWTICQERLDNLSRPLCIPKSESKECIPPPPISSHVDWKVVAAALKDCGVGAIQYTIRLAQQRELTPTDVCDACETFRANRSKFHDGRAIVHFVEYGEWPADGVRSPGEIAEALRVKREASEARVASFQESRQQDSAGDYRNLEATYGPQLDAMQPHELTALIQRAGHNDDPHGFFMLRFNMGKPTERSILLSQLEEEAKEKSC